MKVTIRKDSPRFEDWVRIFGILPVEVEPAPQRGPTARYRVVLSSLKILQRQRCTVYMAMRTHKPSDQAARIAPLVDAADVDVVEELG